MPCARVAPREPSSRSSGRHCCITWKRRRAKAHRQHRQSRLAPPAERIRAPWLPPVTQTKTRSKPSSSVSAGNGSSRSRENFGAGRGCRSGALCQPQLGLQVARLAETKSRSTSTRLDSSRLTRPSTAFCSWITLGSLAEDGRRSSARQRPDSRRSPQQRSGESSRNRRSAMRRPSITELTAPPAT